MSNQAVNWIGTGRYELRNYEYPDRPGQHLQFMCKEYDSTEDKNTVVVDGTSVDDIVKVLAHRIAVLDEKESCAENLEILGHLSAITNLLRQRRRNRDTQMSLF